MSEQVAADGDELRLGGVSAHGLQTGVKERK